MSTGKRTGEYARGPMQFIDFTNSSGCVVKRWMVPLLDEHGGIVRWDITRNCDSRAVAS